MQWHDDPLLKTAVPLAPETLLRNLAGVAVADAPPHLTIHLVGGHVLSGGLVAVGSDHGNETVVLMNPESSRFGYALVSSIVAVELHNPEPFRDLLSAGRVPVPQTGEPPTLLALRREFASSKGFPVDVDWSALDQSGVMIGTLADLLRGLRDAVASIRTDDMGRRAWAQVSTLRVEHRSGSSLSVQTITDGLAVHTDWSAALPRTLPDALASKISALL